MSGDEGQPTKVAETRGRISRICRVEDCLLSALANAKGLRCEARLACVLREVLEEYRDELTTLTGDIQLGAATAKEEGTA